MPDQLSVTFVIFAYNQDSFVRAAINGALAQTYTPLKIILSDDCSSDHTYEIMQEMAASYHGPHEVTVRQSTVNRGLLEHINEVAALVETDVIVVAAGDDISYPKRVEVLMQVFCRDFSIMAVLSDFHLTNSPTGNSVSAEIDAEYVSMREIMYDGGGVGVGAAYAYRKECFTWPSKLNPNLFSEDRILPLRGGLLGRVCRVRCPLVFYRQSSDSMGAKLNAQNVWTVIHKPHKEEIKKELKFAQAQSRVGLWERRVLMVYFEARALVAHLIKRRGMPGDVIWRTVGRILDPIFRKILVGRSREAFALQLGKKTLRKND